jgi:hypothetical protein
MNQVSVLGGAVEASQPRQRLLNFIGVESCSTEFATQERQFGTNVTTPVVFVHVYENIEHGRNIPCFEPLKKYLFSQDPTVNYVWSGWHRSGQSSGV